MSHKSGIMPPIDGWKKNTWYLIDVSYSIGNPVHRALFHSGYVDCNNVSRSNSIVPLNGSTPSRQTSADVVYMRVIKEVIDADEASIRLDD